MSQAFERFPSLEEVRAAVDPGRLPYLQLAQKFDEVQRTHHETVEAQAIREGLRDFHLAHLEQTPQPPLSDRLAEILSRAVSLPIIDFRNFDPSLDELRMGRDQSVKEVDNREAGKVIMRAIIDHGTHAGVTHG